MLMCRMTAGPRHIAIDPDEEFLRRFVFSVEERRSVTTAPLRGEYRWFHSTNVVPLERYRTPAEWERICAALLTVRRHLDAGAR
jgi:hypothetical protein